MQVIEWNPCYEVGNACIDAEHRIFLALIQKLARDVADKRDAGRINRTFAEIVKYGEFHFLSEENLMINEGFPGYPAHRKLHVDLLAELHEKYGAYRATCLDMAQVIEFVFDWFARHTVSEDIKIGNFLANKARSAD